MQTYNNKFFLCLFLFVFCSPQSIMAVPAITSTTGAIAHGEAVILSGSAFGSKPTAAPIRFEQFEDDVDDGDILSTGGYWELPNGNGVFYESANQRTANSGFKAIDRMVAEGLNSKFQKNVFNSQAGKKFVSFWCYIDFVNLKATDHWQLKVWRMESGSSHGEYPSSAYETWWTPEGNVDINGHYYENIGTTIDNVWGHNVLPGQWFYIQWELQDSSNVDVADGNLTVTILRSDGVHYKGIKTEKATRTSAYPGIMTYAKFGYLVANSNVAGHEVHTSFDDIYIDNSWARIEIGDNAVYENCTHREIQPASSWSDSGATITLNQGSFADQDTAYLFVVDSTGTVSDGYEITIGDSAQIHRGGGQFSGNGSIH